MKRVTVSLTLLLVQIWASPVGAQTTDGAAPRLPRDPLPAWAQTLHEFLTWDVFNTALWRIVLCILVLLLGLVLKNGLIDRLLRPLELLLDRTSTTLDNALLEAVRRPGSWLVFIFSVWAAFELLQLPPGLDALVLIVLQTLGTGIVAWALFLAIDVAGMALQKFVNHTDSDIDDHLVPLVKRVLRVVLVCFAGIAIVQQWGYDVTSLVAGLGIGGVAFALAAQDTLSNWFGSLMIFTDRPFRIGDTVRAGSIEGVIEEVGLRSTKVRTFDKSLITVPNKKIANENCENLSMREQRRINMTIGLEYRTTRAQMLQIIEEVTTVLTEHPMTDNSTINVFFTGFGASSLDLLVVVFLNTNSFAEFAPARQQILLEVMRVIEDVGSSFAFPSQSLYMHTPIETRTAA